MFELMATLFTVFFVIVLGVIVFKALMGVKQWNHNNQQPVLTVDARIVAKRDHVSRSAHNHGGHVHRHNSTTYYATFEVESGDRMELMVSGSEFGMLAEGDKGRLTFQGTRYHGFERH
jgi:hypothetical protein